MQGATSSRLALSPGTVPSLVSALQHAAELPPQAESALVRAIGLGVSAVPEAGGARAAAQAAVLAQLTRPLLSTLAAAGAALSAHTLAHAQQQAGAPSPASQPPQLPPPLVLPVGGTSALRSQLRHLELLLSSCVADLELGGGDDSEGGGAWDRAAFASLSDTLLRDAWPALSALLTRGRMAGPFLAPLSRALVVAMRADAARVEPCLPSLCEALVCALLAPGGHPAGDALSAALDVFGSGGSPHCVTLLQQVVSHVLSDPRASGLSAGGAADAQPELAEALMRMLAAYARSVLPHACATDPGGAAAAVGAALRAAAACTCSHHRGVAAAALSVTEHVAGAASRAARGASGAATAAGAAAGVAPGGAAPTGAAAADVLARSVLSCGGVVASGVIGGLLSTFPLSRLHKAASVLAELGWLAGGSAAGQALAAGGQYGGAPAGQAPTLQLLAGWLGGGTAMWPQLAEPERQSIAGAWPAAVLEAAAGLSLRDVREQGLSSRKLKKLLRVFADAHARDT
ncbi:hypothetical protein FOA52_002567 [Chlamydomonas sp. UWO 241]|nr:hypothetical protein FOA52_002567 [Chlamydomonas sp. UWO 241]